MNEQSPTLEELFVLADKGGKKRYHRLTSQEFEDYRIRLDLPCVWPEIC